MHKNLRKTDDRLLELQGKLEKQGDRSDLEEEIKHLRGRVAELEDNEQNQETVMYIKLTYHKDLEKQGDLRDCFVLLTVTPLIHVTK